jgi:hypothetical protein
VQHGLLAQFRNAGPGEVGAELPAPLGVVDQPGEELEQTVLAASVAPARAKRMPMALLGPRSVARSRQVSSEEANVCGRVESGVGECAKVSEC